MTLYLPEGGKVTATGWSPYRRIVCGGSINVSAGRRVVQPYIAQPYQTENFKVHPSDRLPFPLEFCNNNAALENHSGRATRPRKQFDDIFSRLDTIPACDRHSDIQTRCNSKNALRIYASRSTNSSIFSRPSQNTSNSSASPIISQTSGNAYIVCNK